MVFVEEKDGCFGCQIGIYLSNFEVKWADCCRSCKHINYQNQMYKDCEKRDPMMAQYKLYCKKHDLLMNVFEICNLFERSRPN